MMKTHTGAFVMFQDLYLPKFWIDIISGPLINTLYQEFHVRILLFVSLKCEAHLILFLTSWRLRPVVCRGASRLPHREQQKPPSNPS